MFCYFFFFFFKQKTAYEMRISDWSSDVCSSDLLGHLAAGRQTSALRRYRFGLRAQGDLGFEKRVTRFSILGALVGVGQMPHALNPFAKRHGQGPISLFTRSEEHTSELQSLMRLSYAVFCLKKNKDNK